MNYYDILEVAHTASQEVIQNAYKTLAKKYHPDVFQGDKSFAEDQMKRINEAYEVLSDPQKRMEYDRRIKDAPNSNSDNEETAKNNSSNVADTKEPEQPKVKQKRKKPFWALSWIFICFLMFLSIMFEWKWMFWVSLFLGCARFIVNKKEPAYKTRGLVRIISLGTVGFMLFSCYIMLYYEGTSVVQTNESNMTATHDAYNDTNYNSDSFNSSNTATIPQTPGKAENDYIFDSLEITESPDIADTEEKTTDSYINKDIFQKEIQLFNKTPKKYNIVHGTSFSDGITFIKYYEEDDIITAYENHSFIYAAIDTSGNELFRLDDFQETENFPIVQGGIYIRNNSVYNNKGQLIASPQISEYDEIYENHNGYVLVTKYTESYKGAYYSVGVINNKGEWEVPLCEEGEWKSEDYFYTWTNRNTYYGVDYYVSKEEIKTNIVGQNGQDIVSVNDKGDITLILKNHEGLLSILSNTVGNELKIFGDEFLVAAEYTYDSDIYDWVTGPYNVLDFDGNILLDLSEYDIVSEYGCDYYNGYFLFVVENNNGSEYLCLADKNGELVVEPIKVYYPKVNKTYYPLNENGYVFYDADTDSYKHIGYDGNIIEYSNVDDFYGFSDGLALVHNDQTYKYYYINYKGEIIIE